MNEESQNYRIDPDLEARIYALVLGEASDLERDQLSKLIDKHPEFADLKSQVETVNGLLREVGAGEIAVADDQWKLSADKRSKVLAVFEGRAVEPSVLPLIGKSNDSSRVIGWSSFWGIAKIAAVFCAIGLVGLMALVPAMQSARRVSQTSSIERFEAGAEFAEGAITLDSDFAAYGKDGAASSDTPRSRPAVVASSDYDSDLKSSLSDIRESLGAVAPAAPAPVAEYFMFDDLQRVQDGLQIEQSSERTSGFGRGMGGMDAGLELRGGTKMDFGKSLSDEYQPEAVEKSRDSVTWMEREERRETAQSYFDADRRSMVEKPDTPIVGDLSVAKGLGLQREEKIAITKSGRHIGDFPVGRADAKSHWRFDARANGSLGEPLPSIDSNGNLPHDYPSASNWEQLGRRRIGRFGESEPLSGADVDSVKLSLGFIPSQTQAGRSLEKQEPAKKPSVGLQEKSSADEPFSTFSLHVSDVSFKLAQAALAVGQWPDPAKVRIEEFVNAFDYGDPMPSQNERISCRLEQSIHPFLQQRNLLRVSMRTAAAGRASDTPLRLTFLLDNSGSMERVDRQQTVRRAFALLAAELKPIDQVTLISFARQPRLMADKVSGDQSSQLVQLIDNMPSEGGTNLEAALQLAFEKAKEQQVEGAQNRIVLLTDGAVNLGDAEPESLSHLIMTMRDAGIAFDAAGISADGLNDEVLEALTRKGDGRYYLLDSSEDADDGFARQIAGALRPSAKNVKVQVEFNPKRVGNYKLLGFEKHLLNQEDFRNDKVDAAEMAAAEAGVAIYQFEAKPDGEGDIGSVSVRFRDLSTDQMIENRWPIPYEADAARIDQAAASLRIATSAALFAAKLRGDSLGESADLQTLSELISGLPDRERNAKRVQQLLQMISQARQISGN